MHDGDFLSFHDLSVHGGAPPVLKISTKNEKSFSLLRRTMKSGRRPRLTKKLVFPLEAGILSPIAYVCLRMVKARVGRRSSAV